MVKNVKRWSHLSGCNLPQLLASKTTVNTCITKNTWRKCRRHTESKRGWISVGGRREGNRGKRWGIHHGRSFTHYAWFMRSSLTIFEELSIFQMDNFTAPAPPLPPPPPCPPFIPALTGSRIDIPYRGQKGKHIWHQFFNMCWIHTFTYCKGHGQICELI